MDDLHARLLLTERDSLLPILRAASPPDFDLPTVCTLWSVRDVLAHCAAALIRVATGTAHSFSPEDNQKDVDERASWSVDAVLTELRQAYEMGAVSPAVKRVALGEWIHGGDVREALGRDDAYASPGIEGALTLIEQRTAAAERPHVVVLLSTGRTLNLGAPDSPVSGTVRTDPAGLVRIVAGRHPERAQADFEGVTAAELALWS